MNTQDDDMYHFGEDAEVEKPAAKASGSSAPWKVLMVDDSPEVHQVTRMVLRNVRFLGRPIEFICGYSAAEGRKLIKKHPDVAVAFLDVVMETDHAGLDLAKFIREDAGNKLVRIILRTGQPGRAPETAVVLQYDINDYKNKSELSDDHLHTALIVALRAYNGLIESERMASEMKRLTHLQRTILDSANFSIIATDADGLIKYFNAGAERLLGYTSSEMVDINSPSIIHDLQEIVERAHQSSIELGREIAPGFEAFAAKARGGRPYEDEWTYIRKDGSRLPVMLSITAIFDSSHTITGFMGVAHDLTERKKTEQLKNDFISTVSHELRTPLTSIRGSLGLLTAGVVGEIPERAQALLNIASNNCARLVRLINDLLDIEKVESGNMRYDMVTQRLWPLVEKSIEATNDYAMSYHVRFVLHSGADDVVVTADADRITQVIVNLLSNAAKFSPQNGQVDIKLAPASAVGMVRLSVTDRGHGIPGEFKERIFQKFAQADGSDTKKKGGTGLGLSICKAIIEKHLGRIDFVNAPDQGTTFYFEIPIAIVKN